MTKNRTYETHKSTLEGKAQTIERKHQRRNKYAPLVAATRNMGE